MAGNGEKSEPGLRARQAPRRAGNMLSKTRVRLRLIIAIPVTTTLLVLGLGWVIIELNARELLGKITPETAGRMLRINHPFFAYVNYPALFSQFS